MDVKAIVDRVVLRIIEVRKEKKLTLEFMAEQLEMSHAAYNKIEKGETTLSLERLIQIQFALNVTLNELLDLKGGNIYHQSYNDSAVAHQEITNYYNYAGKGVPEPA